MVARQIILLASERSGTNLLRAIISTHPQIASPPPCGVTGLLARRAYKYLSPLRATRLEELIADAILATQVHMNKWDIALDGTEIRRRMVSPSFWGLFQALNEIYAEQKGCTSWLSKEPNLFEYVYEMALHMPTARFIYLARDGRDVAASMLRGGVHEHHIYYAARRWSENQRLCLTALSDPLLQNRIFMLKYEDLIAAPENHVRQLMDFLGLEFDPAQLEFYQSEAVVSHAQASAFWKNVAKPINAANKGNYRKHLRPRDVAIFESVARTEMQLLGYALEHSAQKQISALERGVYRLSAEWRRRQARRSDNEEMRRRRERNAKLQPVLARFSDE